MLFPFRENSRQMTERLALGTAQFGMAYGIANAAGQPDRDTVSEILGVAQASGIDTLDTAIAYGESETVLGQVGVSNWKVVTKLPPVPEEVNDIAGWMEQQVTGSLMRLGIGHLHGLLLHAPAQMHEARAEPIARGLERIAAQGLVGRVGVSIQNPDHDFPAVLRHMVPGLIQAPFNLLDHTLVTQGWAARLRAMGCQIHTRSAFLQGLLLMEPASRPAWCARYTDHFKVWDDWRERHGIEATAACLRFVLTALDVDYAVIGVDTPAQLVALLDVGDALLPELPNWPGPADRDLITPSRWPPK